MNAVISTNETTRIITGHVIYNLAYTYKFQLKTTQAIWLSNQEEMRQSIFLEDLQPLEEHWVYLLASAF